MKYSTPSTESPLSAQAAHPFVSKGGVAAAPQSDRDPFEVLDDLMVVVEALCPQWPQRDVFKKHGLFRM